MSLKILSGPMRGNWECCLESIIQYNTTAFDITLLPKFRSAHASMAQMQLYCRTVVREGLAHGSYTVTAPDEDRTRTLRVTGQPL